MNRKSRLQLIGGKSTASTAAQRLCDRCWSGVVMRSAHAGEDEVFCQVITRPVSNDIVQCNCFAEREGTKAQAAQVHESAWVA